MLMSKRGDGMSRGRFGRWENKLSDEDIAVDVFEPVMKYLAL